MKIGILDVVGGPLTNLLNKLTEAGRLMNAYGQMGGNGKVGRMTSNLASAREENRQSIYNQQQQQFWKYINPREQQLKDIRAWQRGERSEALQKRIGAITEKYGSLDATKIQAEVDAAKKMLAEYQQAARSLLTPVKADIKTDEAEQNVASLTKKLKDLQAQRKKAIAAGDTELSKNLAKQINQVKADIKGLGGSTTTTTTTKHQTPQQRAQESFTKAEQNYKQALEQAAMELQAGTITRAQAAQKEAQAAEQRWKAIGDARNISDSDRLRQAQDEAAAEYKRLAAEAKNRHRAPEGSGQGHPRPGERQPEVGHCPIGNGSGTPAGRPASIQHGQGQGHSRTEGNHATGEGEGGRGARQGGPARHPEGDRADGEHSPRRADDRRDSQGDNPDHQHPIGPNRNTRDTREHHPDHQHQDRQGGDTSHRQGTYSGGECEDGPWT